MRYCNKCIRRVHYACEINENEARELVGTYIEYVSENKCECYCHRGVYNSNNLNRLPDGIVMPKIGYYDVYPERAKDWIPILDRTCEDCGFVATNLQTLKDHRDICIDRKRNRR